jgi:hypothetical protein
MTPQALEKATQKSIASLIPCRKKAFEEGTKKQTRPFGEKYWDLFSFYENNWHYITTFKIKTNTMPSMPSPTQTPTSLAPGQNIEYQGRKGYVIEALEKNQYWVRLHPHPTETHHLDQAAYVLACGTHLTPKD